MVNNRIWLVIQDLWTEFFYVNKEPRKPTTKDIYISKVIDTVMIGELRIWNHNKKYANTKTDKGS